MVENEASLIFAKYGEISLWYGNRNALLHTQDLFYRGVQWEDDETDDNAQELIRVTLNYTRLTILKQVAYLTGKAPRVDVLETGLGVEASKRERYLRAVHKHLWPVWSSSVEHDAAKSGYGVIQAIWAPKVTSRKALDALETPLKEYTTVPFKFRSINPVDFFPMYRTHDEPDDFMYVFIREQDRLIEDLEERYGVALQPTSTLQGTTGTCEVVEYWTKDRYVLMAITTTKNERGAALKDTHTPHIIKDEKHGYGRIPFFVVSNISQPHKNPTIEGSLSDLELVMEVQKHLNLVWSMTATEIMTRMRPPTVYTSDNPTHVASELRIGAGEVIPIESTEKLEFMRWEGIPSTVEQHSDDTMAALSDFGSLPRTEFGGGSTPPSGVGMKLSYGNLELCLTLKVPRRTETFQRIYSFCLEVTEKKLGTAGIINFSFVDTPDVILDVNLLAKDIGGRYECEVSYPNLLPRDKITFEQHIVYLYNAKIISLRTALEMIEDVQDPEAEIARIQKESKDPILFPERVAATTQASTPPLEAGAGGPSQQQPGLDLKFNSAPSVPQSPEMPTGVNTPYLARQPQMPTGQGMGSGLNAGQMFNRSPGVYQGPPTQETI